MSVIRALARLLDASYLGEAPSDEQSDAWREAAADGRAEYDRFKAERDPLKSRLAEALEVLRGLEWVARDVAPGLVRAFCPVCAQPMEARTGHAPDCRLGKLLGGKT